MASMHVIHKPMVTLLVYLLKAGKTYFWPDSGDFDELDQNV